MGLGRYTLDFNVYVGKAEKYSGDGLAHDVVMKLLQPYWFQGYEVFVDNFYTSQILFQHLLSVEVCATGTLRTDRRGVPPAVVQLKTHMQTTKVSRGTGYYYREGDSPVVLLCLLARC